MKAALSWAASPQHLLPASDLGSYAGRHRSVDTLQPDPEPPLHCSHCMDNTAKKSTRTGARNLGYSQNSDLYVPAH
jgi:hypothetical protein